MTALTTLIGGVAAVAVGIVDTWTSRRLGTPLDVALIIAGVGALGVHVGTS